MTFSAFPGIANQALLAVISTGGLQGARGAAALNGVTTIAGASHTLVAGDTNQLLRFTSDSPVTVIVPAGLPSNFDCVFLQGGLGAVTVQAGGGVILRAASGSTKTAYQWAVGYLTRLAADEYLFGGEVTL